MQSDTQPLQRPARPTTARPEACWRVVGVFGDGTCPELKHHIHCRNCAVYADAGGRLLDQPVPAAYRHEWTMHYGRGKPRAAAANASATLFRIGPEWLGLDTMLCQEVAERRPMHTLPQRRSGVLLGLVNVRGELLPCISLSRLLELGHEIPRPSPRQGFRRLMVLSNVELETRIAELRVAFPVDEVYGVLRFNRTELQEPPATVARAARAVTRGVLHWQGHTVGCLDAGALVVQLQQNLT